MRDYWMELQMALTKVEEMVLMRDYWMELQMALMRDYWMEL